MITREDVAAQLKAYLDHRLKLDDLVDWAENVMNEEEFEGASFEAIRHATARLGIADVRSFGLTWEDCEDLLARLGYRAKIEVYEAT